MAKKKEPDLVEKAKFWNDMGESTIRTILAIVSFVIVILSLLASFHHADGTDLSGPAGYYAFSLLTRAFGIGYYLIPVLFTMVGIALLSGMEKKFRTYKTVGSVLFFLSGLGIIHIIGAI